LNAYLIAAYGGESVLYLIVGDKRTDTLPNFPVFNTTWKYAFAYGNDQIENLNINSLLLYRVGNGGVALIQNLCDSLGTPWYASWETESEINLISQNRNSESKIDTTRIDIKKYLMRKRY
jgi:hypothetical protein